MCALLWSVNLRCVLLNLVSFDLTHIRITSLKWDSMAIAHAAVEQFMHPWLDTNKKNHIKLSLWPLQPKHNKIVRTQMLLFMLQLKDIEHIIFHKVQIDHDVDAFRSSSNIHVLLIFRFGAHTAAK